MPKIKEDGEKKLEDYKLQILLSEIGIFTNLKTKNIKFNPTPFKEKKQKEELPTFIDLHLDITSKIDEVIKKHGLQSIKQEEPIEETTLTQIRKPWSRTPTRPIFKTETIQDNFEINDTLFEVERLPSFNQNIRMNNLTPLSNKITTFDEPLNLDNIDFIKKIDEPQNVLTSLGRIKVNRNLNKTQPTTTQKTNGVTFAKTDLEITKAELERKKHELEEMQRLAKEKEEELKKKEHEKKKEEKFRKEKQKEQEKERRIREKQLKIEQKRQEKLKKIEEKKWLKQQELETKLKEKEEKQKQKLQEKNSEIKEKNLKKYDETKIKTEIETQKPINTIISEKTQIVPEKTTIDVLDEEVGQALEIIDKLLEKLPEETIEEFVKSNDFEIYERVVNKYKKK